MEKVQAGVQQGSVPTGLVLSLLLAGHMAVPPLLGHIPPY